MTDTTVKLQHVNSTSSCTFHALLHVQDFVTPLKVIDDINTHKASQSQIGVNFTSGDNNKYNI